MELKLKDGDYAADGAGLLCSLNGEAAVVQRAMMRIAARQGGFPAWPEYGSRLHTLGRVRPTQRSAAARQFAAEALAEEPEVTLEAVTYIPGADGGTVELTLSCGSTAASAAFRV